MAQQKGSCRQQTSTSQGKQAIANLQALIDNNNNDSNNDNQHDVPPEEDLLGVLRQLLAVVLRPQPRRVEAAVFWLLVLPMALLMVDASVFKIDVGGEQTHC